MRCPVCKSSQVKRFYEYDFHTLLNCTVCDLIYQEQDSVNISGLITEIYDDDWIAMRHKYMQNTFLEHTVLNLLLLDIFAPNKGELLEIGSGTGEFLHLAQAAGWRIAGIEPSRAACSYARKIYGLNLENTFWKPGTIRDSFDAITFWHVLEHICQPVVFLKEIAAALKPQGLVLFSTPNRDSFTNKVNGYDSPLFLEKDHLFHYSARHLRMLLEEIPLDILALFSREEPNRVLRDIKAGQQHSDISAKISFPEIMAFLARLQGNMEGHELFCIARKKI